MKNIFDNAYFGKAYKTRNGRKAIFQYKDSSLAHLFTEDDEIEAYLTNGCVDSRFFNQSKDIVSEWQEEIDEEELSKLAEEFCDTIEFEPTQLNESQTGMDYRYTYMHLIKCYKKGYRKAKER